MPWLLAALGAVGGAAGTAAGALGTAATGLGSAIAGGATAAAPAVGATLAEGATAAIPVAGSGAVPGALASGLTTLGGGLSTVGSGLTNAMPNFASWLSDQGTGGQIASRAFGLSPNGGLLGDQGGFLGSGQGGPIGQEFGSLLQNRLSTRSRGLIPPPDLPPNNPGLIGGLLGKVGFHHGM